jgi:signal transduction histidine kinase
MEATKDSMIIDALMPIVIIIFIIGVSVVLLYQYFQKNLFIQKLKQETLKSNHQTDLLRSSIQAQEEERKRIAQDLHDELGAVLSIMRMNLVLLEQQNSAADERLLTGLHNARQLSETALTSVRAISHRLMPPQMQAFGLTGALRSVVNQIENTGKISIQLDTPPSTTELGWAINLGMYRIVMELINNTIKHSGATEIKIDIQHNGTHISCHYSDNGKGLADKSADSGLGHKSIEGRVHSLDGKYEMGNGQDGGFYAIIQIPCTLVQ